MFEEKKTKLQAKDLVKGFTFIDEYTRCTIRDIVTNCFGRSNFECDCVTVLPEHEFEALKKEIEARNQRLQSEAREAME